MKRLFLVLLVGIFSLAAYCQDDLKVEQLGLAYITADKVQTELKLTASQKSMVKSEFQSYLLQAQQILKGVTKENEKERKSQLKKVQDKVAAKILGKLTPAQTLRLRQLVLQIKGSWAILVPEVKKTLKITSAQEKQIRGYQKDVVDKLTALENQRRQQLSLIPRPSNTKDEAAVNAYKKKIEDQIAAFRKTDVATIASYENDGKVKALNVLTAAQRKAWIAMLGPKWNAK